MIEWRQAGPLPYSQVLNDVVWQLSSQLSAILDADPQVGIGLCGSAARGDFVDGWSDIDLIGWSLEPRSPSARQVTRTVARIADHHGLRISLRLADTHGSDAARSGDLYDQKLRAVLSRQHIELPAITGTTTPPRTDPPRASELPGIVDQLHDFATEHLHKPASSRVERIDQARRVLSVASSVARNTAAALDPTTSLRLPPASALLHSRWPDCLLALLLDDYSHFRQHGAGDIDTAEDLATKVPQALADLRRLVTEPGAMVARMENEP